MISKTIVILSVIRFLRTKTDHVEEIIEGNKVINFVRLYKY